MRAAIYARVSTSEQTVAPQIDALREYAERRGLEVFGVYTDEGVSGAKPKRPALDRLLRDARRRRFDAVVVVKLDRLGRSLHHLLGVLGELEALRIDFVSLDDGIDSRTPAGRLFMQIRGAFAEYERGLIVERTVAGMAAARRRGRRIGRPRAEVDRVAVLQSLRSGASVRQLARKLGIAWATARRVALEELELSERVAGGAPKTAAPARGVAAS